MSSIAEVKATLASIDQDMPRRELQAVAATFDELAQRLSLVMCNTASQDMLGAVALLKHLDESCMLMHRTMGDVVRTVDSYAETL